MLFRSFAGGGDDTVYAGTGDDEVQGQGGDDKLWGLSSKLRLRLLFPLTFQHRAGVSSYTSSFDLAETCVFGKQSLGPLLCDLSLLFAFAYIF